VACARAKIGSRVRERRGQAHGHLATPHFAERHGRIAPRGMVRHAAFAVVDCTSRLGQIAVERQRVPSQIEMSIEQQWHGSLFLELNFAKPQDHFYLDGRSER
jgi:hypothetical protein